MNMLAQVKQNQIHLQLIGLNKANNLNNKTQKKGDLAQKLADIGKITTKLKIVRKLFPNYPLTNKIIREVESLKSKAKRRKKTTKTIRKKIKDK